MSDYDKEVLTASALLERLDNIEAFFKDAKVIDLNVDNLMLANKSIHFRLGNIEAWLKQLEVERNSISSNLVDIEDRLNELEEGRHGVIRLD